MLGQVKLKTKRLKHLIVFASIPALFMLSSCSKAELPETGDMADSELRVQSEGPWVVRSAVPVYPGCEGLDNDEERRNCMSQKIREHLTQDFYKNIEKKNAGPIEIISGFTVDKDSNIIEVISRAPHPRLEAEAKRIISKRRVDEK